MSFIYKSKILLFENIIDSFGIIQLSLKEGYIEFQDSMRKTGQGKLAEFCKATNFQRISQNKVSTLLY